MTDEQQARVKTWVSEWKLAGGHASELYAGACIDVRLRNGADCLWVVWEPRTMVPRKGTFCNTLEEALDLASAKLRESP
jgi:hypothetical protein